MSDFSKNYFLYIIIVMNHKNVVDCLSEDALFWQRNGFKSVCTLYFTVDNGSG